MKAYHNTLVDVAGEGDGYILGAGYSVPVQAKFENLKAIIDTAKTSRPPRSA